MRSTATMVEKSESGEGRRKWPRRPIFMPSTIRALGHATEKMLLLNLSKSGFMGETKREFQRGCFIEVMLPGVGHVRGRIVWCERGRIGGQSLQAI